MRRTEETPTHEDEVSLKYHKTRRTVEYLGTVISLIGMGVSLTYSAFGLFKDFPQEYSDIEKLLLVGAPYTFLGCGMSLIKSIYGAKEHSKKIRELERKNE